MARLSDQMTPKGRTVAIIAAAMTLLAIPALVARAEPPKSQTLDELRAAVASIISKNHIPGVGIAVVAKDRIAWAGGVGKANLATGKDADPDTMFRIASITKCFVALSCCALTWYFALWGLIPMLSWTL